MLRVADEPVDVVRGREDVEMRQHDAFRKARRARREDDVRRVVGGHGLSVGRFKPFPVVDLVVFKRNAHLRLEAEREPRLREIQNVRQFLRIGVRVDDDIDDVQQMGGEIDVDEIQLRPRGQRDAVAFAQAVGLQEGRGLHDLFIQGRIRHALFGGRNQRHGLRRLRGMPLNGGKDGAVLRHFPSPVWRSPRRCPPRSSVQTNRLSGS